MYTAKKRSIQRSNITIQKGSLTTLAADAKSGDKVLKITDCSKWNVKRIKRTQVSFRAKEDAKSGYAG